MQKLMFFSRLWRQDIQRIQLSTQILFRDHRRATQFAEALEGMPSFSVNLETVQSNIVFIGVGKGNTKRVITKLSKNGVEILETDDSTIRAVFHLNITDEDLQKSIDVFNRI